MQNLGGNDYSSGNMQPEVKGLIRRVWPGNDPPEMEFIDHVIHELSGFDPDSMSFRYPEDREGNKLIPDLKLINLRHFGQCINDAGKFLEGVQMGISAGLDNNYE